MLGEDEAVALLSRVKNVILIELQGGRE